MSTDTQEQREEDDAAAEATPPANDVDGEEASHNVASPEFQEVNDADAANQPQDLSRIQDIRVTVSADLGRTTIPIQKLMSLGEGSVLELNREIDSPVELVAQGVALAAGEVVVVDGCFAIRVTEVYEGKKE